MSEGDNATPDHRTPEEPTDDDSTWLTRSARRAPAAAPWERAPISTAAAVPDGEAGGEEQSGSEGNHTAGVSVADLIAKITGDVPAALLPRQEPEPEPPAQQWPADTEDRVAADDEPPTVPTPSSAYATDLPDLNAAHGGDEYRGSTEDTVPSGPAGLLRRRRGHIPAGLHPRRRQMMFAGRSVAALMAVLALVLTGGAWQWTASKNNQLNTVAALDLNSRDILDPNAQFGDENFLIVGVDSRIGQNADMGAGNTEDAGGARSDTVMLVNIPADRKRVVAVSFPRDTAITPIKCEAWDPTTGKYGPVWDEESQSYGPDEVYTETKLNSAYSFGGPKCLVKVIQKISGLSINRFMAVDFAGFAKMVDALGGVEVCSTTPLEDYELGSVLPNAGRQLIDGHTALNYVRARQVTTEFNGDYGRIKRQQMFLSSLLRSLISKDTFFSLNKLNNVVNLFINDSYVDNIQTRDLVDLGQSIQGVSAGRVSFITLPTAGITDENGDEVPNNDAIRALFDAIINDDPLPGENDNNATTTPMTDAVQAQDAVKPSETGAPTTEVVNAVTTEPQEVSVHVSNSTGTTGLGTTAATELEQHGFSVDAPDDYSEQLTATTVQYSPGNEQAAATVAAALGQPAIERVTGMGQTVQVVLGSDFTGVKTPPPSGSQVSVNVTHSAGATPTELPEDLTVTNGADTSCE